MILLRDLKATIVVKGATGHRGIAVHGHCGSCNKPITFIVIVYSDLSPREAFDDYWYSLAADCKWTKERTGL